MDTPPPPPDTDLGWVDEFARRVRPYLFVREEDGLLIQLPNQAYRLNPSGLRILGRVLRGEPVARVLGTRLGDPSARRDVHRFFCDVRALARGCLGEGLGRSAVESLPFRRPYHTLPVLSEIAVTYRCNLRCGFCYAAAGPCTARRWPEAGAPAMTSILRAIRHDAQVPSVSFTGGEPALRADLPDLVRRARDQGLRVNLITNGTLLDRRLASELRRAGLASAQVSVEGSHPALHDELVGLRGAFDRTARGLRNLRAEGISCHTNTTLNARNLDDAPALVRLAAERGLDRISMNMAIPCGSVTAGPGGLAVRYRDIGPAVLRARDEARRCGVTFLWYSPTPYCLFHPLAERLGAKACAACDGLLSVAPDGSVLPCSSLFEPVGNLLEDGFRDLWDSEGARFWREKRYAHRICRDCEVFDLCTGACPIYWRAFGHEEIEACGPFREGAGAPGSPRGVPVQ